MSSAVSFGERRLSKRYEITCPMMVDIHGWGRAKVTQFGMLQNISSSGACFSLSDSLALGTRLVLTVMFNGDHSPRGRVRFEAVVKRTDQTTPFLTAVQFRDRGKFVPVGS